MIHPTMSKLKVAGMLAILVLLVGSRGIPAGDVAHADTSAGATNASCASSVRLAYNSVEQSTAAQNALASSAYLQGIVGYYNVTFSSVFQTGQFTSAYPTCANDVKSYNVVFALHNSTGAFAGFLVVGETPSLVVTGFELQTQVARANTDNYVWAGQQVQANAGATTTIESVDADWTQPTPSAASGGCGTAETCNVAAWVGLVNENQGLPDGYLDQAGTLANCNTSSSSSTTCSSYTYNAFYEVLDQEGVVLCDSSTNGGTVTVSGGDGISAGTTNGAYYGNSAYDYDFFVEDLHNSEYCSATQEDPDMDAPTYGEAMAENYGDPANGAYAPLADFTNPSFTGATIYTTPSSYGYFNAYTTASINMFNQENLLGICYGSGVTDATAGSLNAYGDFSVTYDSSQYTPWWSSNC